MQDLMNYMHNQTDIDLGIKMSTQDYMRSVLATKQQRLKERNEIQRSETKWKLRKRYILANIVQ